MDLYTLEDLKDKNGKIDYEEARGCIETWVADLKCQLDEKDVREDYKKIANIGIELFGLFGLGWELK